MPPGCFLFEGKVSSFTASKLPPLEDGSILWEVRNHKVLKHGRIMYYLEGITPTNILKTVEDYQVGLRGVLKILLEKAAVVRSLCCLLAMAGEAEQAVEDEGEEAPVEVPSL